jgi:hypothetical protein
MKLTHLLATAAEIFGVSDAGPHAWGMSFEGGTVSASIIDEAGCNSQSQEVAKLWAYALWLCGSHSMN